MRRASRTDASQQGIVDALRQAGCAVWVIGTPCDLLVRLPRDPPGVFRCLEVKTPTATGKRRVRRDQEAQEAFLRETRTPVVLTPVRALEALGLTGFGAP